MEEMIAFNKESNPAKAVQSSEQPLDVTELSDEEKKKQQEAESRREKEAERKQELGESCPLDTPWPLHL